MFHGFRIIDGLLSGLEHFMEEKGFATLPDLVGQSLPYLTAQPSLDRTCAVKAEVRTDRCIKCLRCYVSCRDGAYGAVEIGSDRTPRILEDRCQGCSLCSLVCPVEGAIDMVRVRAKRRGRRRLRA
jgi:dihydropyrimidine dehydrogenase (NAD+) subunit PreA